MSVKLQTFARNVRDCSARACKASLVLICMTRKRPTRKNGPFWTAGQKLGSACACMLAEAINVLHGKTCKQVLGDVNRAIGAVWSGLCPQRVGLHSLNESLHVRDNFVN